MAQIEVINGTATTDPKTGDIIIHADSSPKPAEPVQPTPEAKPSAEKPASEVKPEPAKPLPAGEVQKPEAVAPAPVKMPTPTLAFCPICGSYLSNPTSHFCPHCGSDLQAAHSPAFCPHCGSALPYANAAYCPSCSAHLAPETKVVNPSFKPTTSSINILPEPDEEKTDKKVAAPTDKYAKVAKHIAGEGIALLILAAGVGAFYQFAIDGFPALFPFAGYALMAAGVLGLAAAILALINKNKRDMILGIVTFGLFALALGTLTWSFLDSANGFANCLALFQADKFVGFFGDFMNKITDTNFLTELSMFIVHYAVAILGLFAFFWSLAFMILSFPKKNSESNQ